MKVKGNTGSSQPWPSSALLRLWESSRHCFIQSRDECFLAANLFQNVFSMKKTMKTVVFESSTDCLRLKSAHKLLMDNKCEEETPNWKQVNFFLLVCFWKRHTKKLQGWSLEDRRNWVWDSAILRLFPHLHFELEVLLLAHSRSQWGDKWSPIHNQTTVLFPV